jgi:hypothetical protein
LGPVIRRNLVEGLRKLGETEFAQQIFLRIIFEVFKSVEWLFQEEEVGRS